MQKASEFSESGLVDLLKASDGGALVERDIPSDGGSSSGSGSFCESAKSDRKARARARSIKVH